MFDYGFEEDLDFIPFLEESRVGRPRQDFVLTIEAAKEIIKRIFFSLLPFIIDCTVPRS